MRLQRVLHPGDNRGADIYVGPVCILHNQRFNECYRYSAYSGQKGADASYTAAVSWLTARSASIRPLPKHSS